jgi:hypothetical protein
MRSCAMSDAMSEVFSWSRRASLVLRTWSISASRRATSVVSALAWASARSAFQAPEFMIERCEAIGNVSYFHLRHLSGSRTSVDATAGGWPSEEEACPRLGPLHVSAIILQQQPASWRRAEPHRRPGSLGARRR